MYQAVTASKCIHLTKSEVIQGSNFSSHHAERYQVGQHVLHFAPRNNYLEYLISSVW
jgi:hypothetical protein